MLSHGKMVVWCGVALTALSLAAAGGLSVGSASLGLNQAIPALVGEILSGRSPLDPAQRSILLEIRLPRVLLSATVGSALSICGVVLQALLRNPLAEPFILGISSGAAVGALLFMLLGAAVHPLSIQAAAFLGALGTVLLVFAVSGSRGRIQTTTLLLTGVIVNAFFTSWIMILLVTSPEHQLQSMLFWLYGDLASASMGRTLALALLLLLVLGVIQFHARGLNVLVAGEETALTLGIRVEHYKWILIGLTSLLAGASVALSGIIGFVGLIVPHVVRMAFGPDHRYLIPLSALWGGVFLILADIAARTLFFPNEIPVGVVTAALGAPFFILLLRRRGPQWNLW